jgi:hypothetical protein
MLQLVGIILSSHGEARHYALEGRQISIAKPAGFCYSMAKKINPSGWFIGFSLNT